MPVPMSAPARFLCTAAPAAPGTGPSAAEAPRPARRRALLGVPALWCASSTRLRGTLALLGAALATPAAGQGGGAWPDRPVHLVVPFAPGSAPDVIGRQFGQELATALGVPVVVDNVPGAGGTIGVDRVARAPADGYTLVLSGDAAMIADPRYGPKPPYTPGRDLLAISQLVTMPNIVVVGNEVAARTLAEFVALVKSQPGRFAYASAGNGTSSHRGGELLNARAGLDMVHVPTSGSPLPDVIGGRVQVFFANPAALPLIREGKLRALAVSAPQRLAALPDVPTMAEAGYPDIDVAAWFGLFAPRGTPAPVVQRLEQEARAAIARPALNGRLRELGAVPVGGPATALAALVDKAAVATQ